MKYLDLERDEIEEIDSTCFNCGYPFDKGDTCFRVDSPRFLFRIFCSVACARETYREEKQFDIKEP